jgi:hypothetical protein
MLPRCAFAQSFHSITQETIRLPEEISPAVLQAALTRLRLLYNQLASRMDWRHYPNPSGSHYCLKDAYEEAVHRVENLAAFPLPKPAPPAPAPPAPPQRRSLADVLYPFTEEG